jgi:hypothetical protein
MPTIHVPLLDDEEVPLSLQQTFTTVYHRARYHLRIDYSAPLVHPVSGEDAEWIASLTTGPRRPDEEQE